VPPEPRSVERSRLELTDDGPLLVSGPVQLVLPDGTTVESDRPVTAVCLCRRSRRYPICDTSHRTRTRVGAPSTTEETPQ
jgi:CDGSH-type Zn-finger protein